MAQQIDLFKLLGEAFKIDTMIDELEEDEVRAEIVVMSHLSDAQSLISLGNKRDADTKIMFVKYILLSCGGNLRGYINPTQLWEKFNNKC